MRQRNDTGYRQHVSAWPTDEFPDHAPFDVGPGEEKDFPTLLAGFTSLEPPQPDTAQETGDAADAAESGADAQDEPAPPAANPARPRKAAKTTAAPNAEGGESA